MTFKPKLWYPIAMGLAALNLVALGFAVAPGELWHAGVHGALAAAFGLWAGRLKRTPVDAGDVEARLEELEFELSKIRQELGETQERLDFTERLLAQGAETRRVLPEP